MVRAGICLGLSILVMLFPPLVTGQSEGFYNVIEDIEWHPSDNVLAVAYSNGSIEVVDQTNQTIIFQQTVRTPVYGIEWSPDGTRLATNSAENVLVWDVTTGQLVITLSGSSFSGDIPTEAGTAQEAVYDMNWNTANQLASIAISGEFRIWDMNNLQPVTEAFIRQSGALSWLPDNSRLLTTSGIVIVTIDPTSGAEERWQEDGGYSDIASAITWSTDGTKFAIGDLFGRVSVRNHKTGEFIDATPITDIPVTDLAWSPDGSIIAAASADGSVHLYNAETLALQQTLLRTNSLTIAWSPDGTKLAFEGRVGKVEVKSLPTANPGPNRTLTDTDNDGTELVTLNGTASTDPDGTIDTYEWLENGVVIAEGENPQVELEVGEHTIMLKVTDDDGLVDMAEVVVSIDRGPSSNAIRDIRWNPVNQYLAVAYEDGLVEVIDQDTQVVIYQQTLPAPLYRLSWNSDGTLLAIASVNRVKVVNIANAQVVYDLEGSSLSSQVDTEAGPQQEIVYSLDWSSGSKLATITTSGTLRFWDMTSGQMIVETVVGQAGGITWRNDNAGVLTVSGTRIAEINAQSGTRTLWRTDGGGIDQSVSIQWSSTGTLFAVGSIYGELAIWDDASPSGLPVSNTRDILPVIVDIDWNIDDSLLATASVDGTVRIYDPNTLDVLQTFTQSDVVRAVAWSADGAALAFGGATGTLEVKSLPTANPGPDQTLTDTDNDGTELVTLNATASIDPDGMIERYEWLENGGVIAEGANPQVELAPGEHTITLKVTDNDGLVDIAEVVIEVVD